MSYSTLSYIWLELAISLFLYDSASEKIISTEN